MTTTQNLQNRYNGKIHTISADQHTGFRCHDDATTTCGVKITGDRMEWTTDEATCRRCSA